MNRGVLIDRDGTLITEENYLSDPEHVKFTAGAVEAVKALNDAGRRVVVVSNQAGIARGLFGEDTVREIHCRIDLLLKLEDARIDRYYLCPHHPDFGGPCRCRKPEPGMVLDAIRDFDLNPQASWIIGDRVGDVEAGLRAGVPGILVRTGYGRKEEELLARPGQAHPQLVSDNLAAAVEWILG